MRKKRLLLIALLGVLLVTAGLAACGKAPEEKVGESPVLEGVALNPHPTSLEGKTVLLRWNGKPNGDKLLARVAELLTEQVAGVKIIRLWEEDAATATSSESLEDSEKIAEKIAAYHPDMVIASQCD